MSLIDKSTKLMDNYKKKNHPESLCDDYVACMLVHMETPWTEKGNTGNYVV